LELVAGSLEYIFFIFSILSKVSFEVFLTSLGIVLISRRNVSCWIEFLIYRVEISIELNPERISIFIKETFFKMDGHGNGVQSLLKKKDYRKGGL